ncbi:MAG: M23 family metallopeptidase [Bacteroidota bacterium]
MKRVIITLLILAVNNVSWAQAPKKYDLVPPLDIPLILSGTFGELRSNHFHSGIDIKTKGIIGFPVKSISDGYISRISVSPWGYGKAIYVTHPNGLTSVYAHLQKFSPEIEKFVKNKQYDKKSYAINLFLKKGDLDVKKNDTIGKSGNSGSSGGPHLHFEIRDSKTQMPQNPFNYDYNIKDTRPPKINNVFIYDFDNMEGYDESLNKVNLSFDANKKEFFSNEITVSAGWVGLGVDSYDRLNYANNKNGVYGVKLFVDDELYFDYTMNSLVFSEQRYINSMIDYKYYSENRRRIQKLFLLPGNKLSIYSNNINNGFIKIEEGKKYSLKLMVEDYHGNKSVVNLKLNGTKAKVKTEKPNVNKLVFDYTKNNIFESDSIRVNVPKGALYNNFNFDYNYKNGSHYIGREDIPLHKSYSLEIKANDSLTEKMLIAKVTKRGGTISLGGKFKDGYIKTKTRSFGKFTITYDTKAPEIKGVNIYDGKWMSKDNFLKVKIKDNLSGIKSFNGFIDGEWILMEYDGKKNLLKYDFSDIDLNGKKHTFTLEVTDNVGNLNKYEVSFYR